MIERTSAVSAPASAPIDPHERTADPVELLPSPPSFPGDAAAAMAVLLLESKQTRRDAARASRDASYGAMEAAQREEIARMEDASSARFVSGMVQGGLKLGSAAASFSSAAAHAKSADYGAKRVGLGENPNAALAESYTRAGGFADTDARYWDVAAKTCDAGDAITGQVRDAIGGVVDRAAKEASIRADRSKRSAEQGQDDARDIDDSIDRTVEFLRQYAETRDATRLAALQRL